MWEPDWQQSDGSVDFGVFTSKEAELAHHADVVHWYASWDEGWDAYDGGLAAQVIQSGRIPMITWEAWDRPLGSIIAGSYDDYIDSWARGIAADAPNVVYLRVFHEFNDVYDPGTGSGYPWGVGGGTANTPADLVAAWRHIVDRFRADRAGNVRWVWTPDGEGGDATGLLSASYPGDGYVDEAGWDTYSPYDNVSEYKTITQITSRPLMLSELGSTDPAWIGELSNRLNDGEFAHINAVIYFDQGPVALDTDSPVRDAVRTMLATPAFGSE